MGTDAMRISRNDLSEYVAPIALCALSFASSDLYANPYVWPKQILLATSAATLLVINIRRYKAIPFWYLLITILTMSITVTAHQSWARSLWGRAGSNIGLVSWLGFFTLSMFASLNASRRNFLRNLLIALWITGLFQVIILFYQEGSFWPDAHSVFKNFFGSLGNSDYVSILLGLSLIAVVNLYLMNSAAKMKILFAVTGILIGYQLVIIRVFLGVITIAVGLSVIALTHIHSRTKRVSFFVALATGSAYVGAGFFGIGPFGVHLQQISLLIREVLWRCGWLIWRSNLIIGTGFDSYVEGFRRYRDSHIVEAFSLNLIGDDAHNFLLTTALTLGVIGSLIGIFILFLIGRGFFQILRNREDGKVNPAVYSIAVAAFVASLATPINIVTTSWFAIFFGFLMRDKIRTPLRLSHPILTTSVVLSILTITSYASLPDYLIQKASQVIVESPSSPAVKIRSKDYARAVANPFAQEYTFIEAAADLAGLGLQEQAINVVDMGVRRFPQDYELRKMRIQILKSRGISDPADLKVLSQLDPLKP